MTDFLGEGIPNWVSAVAGLLTVGVAVVAAYYARRAAHWTRRQAEAADVQAAIARDNLAEAVKQTVVAEQAAQRATAEFRVTVRRQDEVRLDSQVPAIVARATLLPLTVRDSRGDPRAEWVPVESQLVLTSDQSLPFRTSVSIEFSNVSVNPARVDITDPVQGETDVRQGTPVIVPPHESRTVVWTRVVSSFALATEEGINDSSVALFRLEFWVRDLSMSVRDEYRFSGDFRYFERDGSRLLVNPEPVFQWSDIVAEPFVSRVYERLDAEVARATVTGELNE